jgi:hypothetical protein
MFVGLWPKKKADVPTADLKKFVDAFDTVKDPILLMKSRSVKQGAEGAIALACSHGGRLIGRRLALLMVDLFRS